MASYSKSKEQTGVLDGLLYDLFAADMAENAK